METRTIEYWNEGEGATLDVFIQNERDQFSAPVTIEVAGYSYGTFEVTFAPLRSGQAGSGVVLSIGDEAWMTSVGGMAVEPARTTRKTPSRSSRPKATPSGS